MPEEYGNTQNVAGRDQALEYDLIWGTPLIKEFPLFSPWHCKENLREINRQLRVIQAGGRH